MNTIAIQHWFSFYSAHSFLPEIDVRQYIKKEIVLPLYIVMFPITAPKYALVTLSPLDLPKLIYIGALN